MLLEAFSKVISDPVYIISMIMAALGLACALIAKKVTKVVRKTEEVKADDKLYLMLKVVGLGLILIAFVFLIIGGASKLDL